MKDKLLQIFQENTGYLYASQMRGSTYRYHLNKMLQNGEVVKVRHGLYMLTNYHSDNEKAIVSAIVPQGVFCLFSAWFYYELSTTVPHRHHIALHRNTKVALPKYPPIALYRWQDKYVELGVTVIEDNGKKLRYYDKEKSVCDAVKFRNKIGDEITYEVLKNYMQSATRNLEQLMIYAKQMKIEKIISPMLKPLL